MEAINEFCKRLTDNKKGIHSGIYSICSAHKTVLEAAMLQAKSDESLLVIESTSNQVDQFGGYTNMTPRDFVQYVQDIAKTVEFPFDRIVLGGDHLGPNAWQGEKASVAMKKAKELVRVYTEAGYQKIHLDASMYCADDEGDRNKPLADAIVAKRVTELCKVCETTWQEKGGREKPVYIIGTEVPVPGGAKEKEDCVTPTTVAGIKHTIEITKNAFYEAGLIDAWQRVIAIVAQPGVEFGDNQVFYYNHENAKELSHALDTEQLVFEAHSTDYQTERCLHDLVADHFCILKVGPWLTYSYREALFSLADMEKELIQEKGNRSNLEVILEEVMLSSAPNYWEKYYHGTEQEKYFRRKYSFSDRSRYYWTNDRLSQAVNKLLSNLSEKEIPLSLISQYMPNLFMPVSEGFIRKNPYDLIIAHIRNTIAAYARACGFTGNEYRINQDENIAI